MGFLNIGKKDEHGKQRRIEHRGKHVRASRTGGLALRAQTKAAGVTLTANTSRGVRASATPIKNTQFAFQNGRFILRGRYGKGPLKLNLSKSGLSFSIKNPLGSFNFSNPKRSSAKFAGLQFRGQKAAQLHFIYFLLVLPVLAVKFLIAVLAITLQILLAVARLAITVLYTLWNITIWGVGLLATLITLVRRTLTRARLWWATRNFDPPQTWTKDAYRAALVLAYVGWGHGRLAEDQAIIWMGNDSGFTHDGDSETVEQQWVAIGKEVDNLLPDGTVSDNKLCAVFFKLTNTWNTFSNKADPVDTLLLMDDLATDTQERTKLQDKFIELFCDTLGLRMETSSDDTRTQSDQDSSETETTPQNTHQPVLDINTAPLAKLKGLPRINTRKAEAILAHRPFNSLDDLTDVKGIGPATVDALRDLGVNVIPG